jgi:hypothetical protein
MGLAHSPLGVLITIVVRVRVCTVTFYPTTWYESSRFNLPPAAAPPPPPLQPPPPLHGRPAAAPSLLRRPFPSPSPSSLLQGGTRRAPHGRLPPGRRAAGLRSTRGGPLPRGRRAAGTRRTRGGPLPRDWRAAGPLPPSATLSSAVGAPLGTATSLADLPSAASEPPAVAAPPAAHFPAVSGPVRSFAAAGTPPGHAFVLTATLPPTFEPPPPAPTQSATLAAAPGHDGSQPAPALSLPDVALLRSQLLASGFPHVPTTSGAPVRGCPLPTTVYSQSSAIISSLRTPSDDADTILAATRAAVTAARQRAQDVARALEQEQAVVDAIERQYAETYCHLTGKGVSDGSPTSARHSADTFEPAPAPALTLRASLHAQAAALTSIRATVTDVLAPDSTQYPRWRDQVLQTLRRYALADHVLSVVPNPLEDWLLMDEVVLSWIHGTLTTELQDIVHVPDATAHRIWGALEAQFLGHRQTRILYLETAFRQLTQGDLSVDEYCRQMKTMVDTLRTLGAPITDECLVLNLLRGLSPCFDRVAPILTRIKPFPTFAETKDDLLLEELRLSATATAAPATALYNAPRVPLCLRGDHLHRTPVSRRLELFGSLLAPRGSRSWSRPWSQEWTRRPGPFTGWLHPDVARTVRGHLGPSPCRPSASFLCRSTSGGALGTSPVSAGAPSPPGPPAPPVWGP